MSPRPKLIRKVSNLPLVSGFKPYGGKESNSTFDPIFLHYEEYEAIRLCDFEMMNHHQASVIMQVSRPTLTRIYAKARYKIAEAFVKGVQIIIEGGKVYFDSEWFSCNSCGCYFNNPEKLIEISMCPLCKSAEIFNCDKIPDDTTDHSFRCEDICLCPRCGLEKEHHLEVPCRNVICPVCGVAMIRKVK